MPRTTLAALTALAGAMALAEAVHKTCLGCHGPAKDRDFVFTRYSP